MNGLTKQRLQDVGQVLLLLVWIVALFHTPVYAQDNDAGEPLPTLAPAPAAEDLQAPTQVDVEPVAGDAAIAARLQNILVATEWFTTPTVSVRDGVVFLDGRTGRTEYRDWARQLALNTQGVVAVVNRVQIIERSPWDFTPALDALREMWRNAVQALPMLGFGIVVLVLAWHVTSFAGQLLRRLLQPQIKNSFLRDLVASALSIPVFLIGLYLVLQVGGLTGLALTVLGGTGVAGLVVGFAFRDIMENLLATVLISTRNPFHAGDRIEVAGYTGIVQRVTTRTTVLLSLDGNHIQIPNATIYKSTITNFTANPCQRQEFRVGISYQDALAEAQALIVGVLDAHAAVLKEPEAQVLVDNLGPLAVELRITFWYDSQVHEGAKVKSSLIRLVKRALVAEGFTLPNGGREVLVTHNDPESALRQPPAPALPKAPTGKPTTHPSSPQAPQETEQLATAAEGDLRSDDKQIQAQARGARTPEEGENLLAQA